MDLKSEPVKKILNKYKFHDLAIEELNKVNRLHSSLTPLVDNYTFSDGSQKDLLKLTGTLPVGYQGRSYNLPIVLWLLDSFPFTPPICLLRPTPAMVVRVGKHVDAGGRIHLPALSSWNHPKSSINGLLAEMILKFEEDPPLSSRTTEKDPNELLAFVSNLKINEGVRPEQPLNKVTVIGGGDLGMASIMSILAKGSLDKLVLIDTESSNKSSTMDLDIYHLPKLEISKDLSSSVGSKVIVVTVNSWSSEQSYASVVQTNVDLYREIIPSLARYSPNAVLLIASQPVDIMTHVAWRQSGFPPCRVIGSGCNLDSDRLCHTLNIALSTHRPAWVIGELSDKKIAVWGNINPGVSQHPELSQGSSSTKPLLNRGLEMLKGRGQRAWSVGLSIADITHSILLDLKKIHSISTLAKGWGGIDTEVFLSLPCVLGASGSARLASGALDKEEDAQLRTSVASLCELLTQLRI